MKTKAALFGIISLMLVGILIAGCSKYDDNVSLVRNGSMDVRPGVPIGKAFDQFFEKSSWESFTSTKKETIVEFNGESQWLGSPVRFTIQFSVNGKRFHLKYVGFNDLPMDNETSLEIVKTILDEYKP